MTDSASQGDSRPIFPMRVVTRTTGLTADLVRAWERRYRAIEPSRTIGKARRYSQSDIARLELLRDVVAEGHSISSVAGLDATSLKGLRDRAHHKVLGGDGRATIDAYLTSIKRFDLPQAEALLARAVQFVRPREAALEFIAPLMRAVGERWHNGTLTVVEEHAATAHVRSVLNMLLRTAAIPDSAPRIVVATPPTHRHEVGALIASVLAAERGVRAVYLGPDVPWRQLASARVAARAELIVLSIAAVGDAATHRNELKALRALAREAEVWVGAPQRYVLEESKNLRTLHTFEEFDLALADRFRP